MSEDKKENKKWKVTPPHFRDMHGSHFVEATCEHGVGHHKGIHGCDGCCATAPEDIWSKVTKEEGFTLIELLVVIAIIGILSALALTALIETQDSISNCESFHYEVGKQVCDE